MTEPDYIYLRGGHSARTLNYIEDQLIHRIWTDGENTVYRTELETNDKQDIWNYYHNQRGGSCNGS